MSLTYLDKHREHIECVLLAYDRLVSSAHDAASAATGEQTMRDWVEGFGYDPEPWESRFVFEFMTFHHPLFQEKTPAFWFSEQCGRGVDPEGILHCPYSIYLIEERVTADTYICRDLLRRHKTHQVTTGLIHGGLDCGSGYLMKLLPESGQAVILSSYDLSLPRRDTEWVVSRFLGQRGSCRSETLLRPAAAGRLFDLWVEAAGLARYEEESPNPTRAVFSYPPNRKVWLRAGLSMVDRLSQSGPDRYIFQNEHRDIVGTVSVEAAEVWIDGDTPGKAELVAGAVVEICGNLLRFKHQVDGGQVVYR